MKASILKINHQKLSCIGGVKGILSRKTREDHQMEFTNEIFLILDEYKIDYEISYSTGENILRITLPDYSDEGKGQLLQFSSPK